VARAYLDHLAVERGLAANTLASYRRDLRRYVQFLVGMGRVEPTDVVESDVTAFLRSLREGDDAYAVEDQFQLSFRFYVP
jgi:integrase/recombinase XerD